MLILIKLQDVWCDVLPDNMFEEYVHAKALSKTTIHAIKGCLVIFWSLCGGSLRKLKDHGLKRMLKKNSGGKHILKARSHAVALKSSKASSK